MALISRSPTNRPNPNLREKAPRKGEGNRKWLASASDKDGIILLGGSSVVDFRVRVAQSSLRHDMLPSFWSMCGILLGGGMFASVPLGSGADVSTIPRTNAVRMCALDEYDDPRRYPNIAVVRFARFHDRVGEDIGRVQGNRSIIDLPALMLPWLGFVWGTSGASNPLLNGTGLPSAAFVETVFAMAGFELTPGLSSASSCPEAIWQSAKWWRDFYKAAEGPEKKTAGSARRPRSKEERPRAVSMAPEGVYGIRQPAAAVIE